MNQKRQMATALALLMFTALGLSACDGTTTTPAGAENGVPLGTQAQSGASCESCAQATLSFGLTQAQSNADNKAAATAAIVRANSQVTLDSANATLSAAQSQQQNKANLLAAQIAATAEIMQVSIHATQIAAMTQSQYDLQVTQAAGTLNAEAMVTQQYKNILAAGTQTAAANIVATQTEIAVATSQWYADQARQREEERQAPIAFLWMWCLPMFIVVFAVLALWGFWRWLQTRQQILENTASRLSAPEAEVASHHHAGLLPYLDSEIIDNGYAPKKPDDQVDQWLDEVKNKLVSADRKEKNDNTDI
jgi:hypothetical protein